MFGYERPKADYEPDSIIEDIVKKFGFESKLSPFLSCCSCLSVFLTLMRDYLRQVCTESAAIPENLAAFEGTLSDLRQRFNTPKPPVHCPQHFLPLSLQHNYSTGSGCASATPTRTPGQAGCGGRMGIARVFPAP